MASTEKVPHITSSIGACVKKSWISPVNKSWILMNIREELELFPVMTAGAGAGTGAANGGGGGRRGSAFHGEDAPLRGQDAEADIMVTL